MKREEERRKRKKRRGRREEAKIKPTRYGNYFEYGFLLWNLKVCMNFHAIGWLLVSLNLGFVGIHLNQRGIEIRVGKTPYCTR